MTDTGVVAAQRAAKAATNQAAGSKCPDCVKQGLVILPVTYTALPAEIRPMGLGMPGVGLAKSELVKGLEALDRGLAAEEVPSHWYVMRSLPAGYLYILRSDETWKGYEVNTQGLLRNIPVSSLPSEPGPEKACSRTEHNPFALQTIVLDPDKDPHVWVAYSRYRWTDKVLQDYRQNKEGCRDGRMFRLNVVEAASANKLGPGTALPNALQMPDRLGGYVADYASPVVRETINRYLLEPLHDRSSSGIGLMIDPKSPSMFKMAVDVMSRNVPRKTGVVLVLTDAVGITAQINHNRNRNAALAAQASGIGDDDKTRKRVVAEVIEGIRANAEANPGPWWNKNYGPERYLKHIDESQWRAALGQSEDAKRYLTLNKSIARDWSTWKESSAWKLQQKFDFDDTDNRSSLDQTKMVAICVCGSGVDEHERKSVWEPVLDLPDTDPDNWLSRALAACDVGLLKFMETSPPTSKDKLDSVGLAKSITSELLVGGDGRMGAIERINNLRQSVRLQRAANQATAVLIESATGIMGRLQQSNPKKYVALLRKITKAGLTRDDIIPQAVIVRSTWERISQWIMEIATGPSRINPRAAISTGPMLDGMEYMMTKGNLRQEGWILSQAVDGAVMFSEPRAGKETAEVVFWVVNKAKSGVNLDAAALRQFGLANIDTSIPSTQVPDNPALRNHLGRMASHADFVVSAAALLYQANTIWGTAAEFWKGNNRLENGIKLFAASLAAAGAGLEVRVVVQTLVTGTTAKELMPVSLFAARLGLVAGVVDGAYTTVQGISKVVSQDSDSGWWAVGSGTTAVAGSIAAYGFTVAGLSALAGSGATATVLGITLGPVGWIFLAVAAVGASVYMAIQAFGTDDKELSPVEYWLDNGIFGRREKVGDSHVKKNPFYSEKGRRVMSFADLNDELLQLQRVTLVAVADMGNVMSSNAAVGFYEIALPRYAKNTELVVKLFGYLKSEKKILVSEFKLADGAVQPQYFRNGSIRLTGGNGVPEIKVDESGAVAIRGKLGSGSGWIVSVNNALQRLFGVTGHEFTEVSGFGMELTYFPDKALYPKLSTQLVFPTRKKS